MITHQSLTRDPQNFEKCSGCNVTLPAHQQRLYQVRIPDQGQHQHSFWCGACQDKALQEKEAA